MCFICVLMLWHTSPVVLADVCITFDGGACYYAGDVLGHAISFGICECGANAQDWFGAPHVLASDPVCFIDHFGGRSWCS